MGTDHSHGDNAATPKTLYKYTTVDGALATLGSQRIRTRSPLDFNDPLDTQWDVLWPLFTPEAKQARINSLRGLIEGAETRPEGVSEEAWREVQKFKALYDTTPTDQKDEILGTFLESFSSSSTLRGQVNDALFDHTRLSRVYSVSERADSVTMWAHYADQHRGVLLEWSVVSLSRDLRIKPRKVQYADNAPAVFDGAAALKAMSFEHEGVVNPAEWFQERVFVKQSEWASEKEWRFLVPPKDGEPPRGLSSDYNFDEKSLLSITKGLRCDGHAWQKVVAAAQMLNDSVEVSEMATQDNRFQVKRVMSDRSYLFPGQAQE